MEKTYKYNPKPKFEERMNLLLTDKEDQEAYWKIVHTRPRSSFRCNTLKIQPDKLKKQLEELHNWTIDQPYSSAPEIMIVTSDLAPGELGKAREHLLGYYYIQEIASMMPMLALKPSENDSLFDCCASPGSKTTQAASMMENKGIIIANDNNVGRMMILASNLEKCGVSNTIITRKDASQLCKSLDRQNIAFDKILADVPCSGEGTLRGTPKTFVIWNPKMVQKFSRRQKALACKALETLKEDREMIYSTCTHAPEENELVIQYLIDTYDIELMPVNIPLKTRPGIQEWEGKTFSPEITKCARVYPQDNNTEGFFICKIKKLSNKKKEQDEENIE